MLHDTSPSLRIVAAKLKPYEQYEPPDSYAAGLAKMRAERPPAPAPPKPPTGYEPPDSYAAGIAKMRREKP